MFAAGIDVVGPSSLVTLLESIPPFWESQHRAVHDTVGDHLHRGRSRLFAGTVAADVRRTKSSKPLIIVQGANDPRVKQSESDQIVAAMQERGIPVTYLLYPDEGHGFGRPDNALSFYAVAEAFLAEHIGGRLEPFGDVLDHSSVIVVEGEEHVPGLVEELNARGR